MQITIHRSDVEMAEHDDNCAKIRTNGMGSCGCGADDETEKLRKSGFKTFATWEASKNKLTPVVAKPKRFTNKMLRDKITKASNLMYTLQRIELRHTDHCTYPNDRIRKCCCYVDRVDKLHYTLNMILSLRE